MRYVKAYINTKNLLHNLSEAKTSLPYERCLAVLKADAYGHGLIEVAKVLAPVADALGVATLGEAMEIRKAGIQSPVLLMGGPKSSMEWPLIWEHGFGVMLHAPWQLEGFLNAPQSFLDVWLKVDTGMHRLGFSRHELQQVVPQIRTKSATGSICFATHLATADEKNDQPMHDQLAIFEETLDKFWQPGDGISFANSAAIVKKVVLNNRYPREAVWMRPGIMLYGASPLEDKIVPSLLPVMSLESHLIAIKSLEPGARVGYGHTFEARKKMQLGIIACGYGDGYPRHVQHAEVLINGVVCPVVGRVSMDLMMVDLKNVDAKIGDKVILWGKDLSVDSVAQKAGTISYELLCQVKPSERIVL